MTVWLLATFLSTWPAALLPSGARIMEIRPLPARGRFLVLWMQTPTDSGCSADTDEPYPISAPAMTRGCYLRGPTRLSLIVAGDAALKGTVPIVGPFETTDSFDVPYLLGREGPYRVRGRFGTPELLWLRDYNGDGLATEVAFFSAESGSDLLTTVVGYEPETERLRRYSFHVVATGSDGATETYETEWLQGLFWFSLQPRRPPHWRFEADYPGGPHESYDVHYNPSERRFDVRVLQRDPS
jgi:hypothetical protein